MSALNHTLTHGRGHTQAKLPGSRAAVLEAVLDPSRLPTPPAVALQIIQAASEPDCRPAQITALLNRDPALCAKILRAVNSCLYGLTKPVGSLERAVLILGLNPFRSLALGLSLPVTHSNAVAEDGMRDYWVSSVSGAIMARELATRLKHQAPEDDLVAGLLRDLGAVLLQRTFPDSWRTIHNQRANSLPDDVCGVEQIAFGVHHAEVTAELLKGWNIPEDTFEPIRHHHNPAQMARASRLQSTRADLLYFVECLTQLDTIAQDITALDRLLAIARERYNLTQTGLVAFLQSVMPKIDEFAALLKLDIGKSPDFAQILGAGAEMLVKLTVEANRTTIGSAGADKTRKPTPSDTMAYAPNQSPPVANTGSGSGRFGGRPLSRLPAFMPAHIEAFPAGGCRLDAYELREVLGRGMMGVVFKAYEPGLDRYSAVKVLTPDLTVDSTARERFAREARTAASIHHENVVMIYTVGESEGISYLALEYVDGGSLQDRLENECPLPIPAVARIGREIAAGLGAAHARQIIHRDIKPANILVESSTGRVKISDFGLARSGKESNLSMEGSLIGTPLFMAPEQIIGKPLDARTDLFSLGGLLYLLATGELPFPGVGVTDVLMRVCDAEPTRPRQVRPEIPEWFEKVILRLLRKEPAARYQTAAELIADMRER